MKSLLIHKVTKSKLDAFIAKPSHGICLFGARGSGKAHIANHLANHLLGSNPHQNAILRLSPDNNQLTIEDVRNMQRFLQLKTTGSQPIRRIVIIEDIQYMRDEAQNALLKTLEEPPIDTVIIITASSKKGIKTTILSRVQHLEVMPIDISAALGSLKPKFDESAITKAFYLSGGKAGLIVALLDDKVGINHPIATELANAKEILRADAFERLLHVEDLAKDKLRVEALLYCMKRLIRVSMNESTAASSQRRVEAVLQAEQALAKNASPKLILSQLFMTL